MVENTLSVAMANYNHGRFIGEALEAILAQSFRPLEIIVVDDASTDNSIEIVEEFVRRDPIVRLVRNERNIGAVRTFDLGLKEASGDYVFFPASDDKVLPGLLAQSMNLLKQNPRAGLCTALPVTLSESGENLGPRRIPIISRTPCYLTPERALAALRRYDGWFTGNTTIYKREALLEAGGFLPELGSYSDGFACRVIALKYGACYIPEPLAMTRIGQGRFSQITAANPDISLEIMRNASRLMRSTYSDVFPEEWVDRWERRWLCTLGSNLIRSSHRAQVAGVRALVPSPSLADRTYLTGIRALMRLESTLTELYLFARFRHSILFNPTELRDLIVRKLNQFSSVPVERSREESQPGN